MATYEVNRLMMILNTGEEVIMQHPEEYQYWFNTWRHQMDATANAYTRRCVERMAQRLHAEEEPPTVLHQLAQYLLYSLRFGSSRLLIALAHWIEPTDGLSSQDALVITQEVTQEEDAIVVETEFRVVEPDQAIRFDPMSKRKQR